MMYKHKLTLGDQADYVDEIQGAQRTQRVLLIERFHQRYIVEAITPLRIPGHARQLLPGEQASLPARLLKQPINLV